MVAAVALSPTVAHAVPPAPSGLIQLADPNECVGDATLQPSCSAAIGLSSSPSNVFAADGIVSPEGKNVYVAIESLTGVTLTGGVLAFQRTSQPGPTFGSLVQLPAPDGCLARDADGPGASPPDISGCTGVQWPEGQPNDMTVSPDGKNVYVTAKGDSDGSPPGAVLMYSRSTTPGPSLGALSYIGCVSNFGDAGCAAASGLIGPSGIDVSPDGRNIYVASEFGNLGSVVALDRSVSDGTLTYANCVNEAGSVEPGCSHTGHGLIGANDVRVSPDGNNIYATSNDGFDGAVAAFARDLTPNTPFGEISQLASQSGCISETGIDHQGGTPGQCIDGRGVDKPGGLMISPDGDNIYVNAANSTLATLKRDSGTGGLSQSISTFACLSNDADGSGPGTPDDPECSGAERLEGPSDLEISPDGRSVYASLGAQSKGAIRALDRDLASGALTALAGAGGCIDSVSWASICTDGEGIGTFVRNALIDPSGKSLYMTSHSFFFSSSSYAATVAEFARSEVVPSFNAPGENIPGAVGIDSIAPSISGLKIRPKRFAVDRRGTSVARKNKKRRHGSKIQYVLSEPASVSFKIERKAVGRMVRGKCRKTRQETRIKRRCSRFGTVGKFRNVSAREGANRQVFSGKIRKRMLHRGTYRLTAIATDAAGNVSRPAKAPFKIVKR